MRADRPSLTARVIARGVVLVAEDPRVRELLRSDAVELNSKLLLEAGVLKPWMLKLYRKPWYRGLAHWIVRNTATGQMMTVPIRKRFMDDEARRAIEGGARQLLVVGAGFDTLALRIAERYPDVQCFEIDHAATQRVKRAAVQSLRIDRPNLHLVAVDLASTSLPDALERAPGWRSDVVTVVTAEGVLCYLDESDVTRLLEGVRGSTASGSTLLLTHMRTDEHGELFCGKHARFMRAALKVVGEPLKWGIRQDELAGFLRAHGFILDRSPTPEQLRVHYLEPVGLGDEIMGDVELMAVARVQ
jgi:methyltransferase (TIGR00027 family)